LRNLSVPHVRLVFHTHETKVRAAFVFRGSQGAAQPVCSPETFANGLEEINEDFARLRGICHASKHLKLRNIRPVPGAPSHIAIPEAFEAGQIVQQARAANPKIQIIARAHTTQRWNT
jgi:hypothetical protein